MIIKKISNTAGASNADLFNELTSILSDSYEDVTPVLYREMEHCKTIYLGFKDSSDEIHSFFMVSWEYVKVNSNQLPGVYLGLSGTRPQFRNKGFVYYCYKAFYDDAFEWVKQNNNPLLIYATTATPSGYFVTQKLFSNVRPFIDGSFDHLHLDTAKAIKEKFNWNEDGHPYVLKSIAGNTLYSEEENQRISKITAHKNFNLFKILNIEEKNGDRLLMIGTIDN